MYDIVIKATRIPDIYIRFVALQINVCHASCSWHVMRMVPSTTYCMVPSNKSYVIQKANVVENLANIKLKLRINTLMQTPYNTHSHTQRLKIIIIHTGCGKRRFRCVFM